MRRFAASLKQRRGRGTMRVLWRLLSSKSGHLRGMATVENSSVVFVVKTQVSSSCVALTKTTHVPSGPRRSCERSYQQKLLKIIVGSMALGGLPLRQTPVLASTTVQLSPVNPSNRALPRRNLLRIETDLRTIVGRRHSSRWQMEGCR